jgi:hypothetical protein
MVDLGPAGAVRVRQKDVVAGGEAVAAQEARHAPFAEETAQPAPLRPPGGERQSKAEKEQERV